MQILQPAGWKRPKGYANGVVASGRMLFVAGQVGWDADEVFRSEDLVEQIRQALRNVLAILDAGGARSTDIVRMTWYLATPPSTTPASRRSARSIATWSATTTRR